MVYETRSQACRKDTRGDQLEGELNSDLCTAVEVCVVDRTCLRTRYAQAKNYYGDETAWNHGESWVEVEMPRLGEAVSSQAYSRRGDNIDSMLPIIYESTAYTQKTDQILSPLPSMGAQG